MKRKNYKATSPSISDSKSVILNGYNQQELETPVLVGHILFQMKEQVSQNKIMSWVQTLNNKNGFFPGINYSMILRMAKLFKTIDDLDCEELEKLCTEPLHMKMPTRCQGKATISTTETTTMISTTVQTSLPSQHCNKHKEKIVKLNNKIKRLNDTIADLKSTLNRKNKLIRKKKKVNKSRNLNKLSSRKVHYICRLNNIMNKNIPPLVESLFKYLDIDGKVYQRTCVNKMPTELGFISDYITADAVLKSDNATLVFDATTQDGVHLNNLMITTPTTSFVVSIEHLPGGTAQDYYLHVTKSIDRLAEVYSIVTLKPLSEIKTKLKSKIVACLTDRASVNHATIYLLEINWKTELIELNCNVHPLEAISRDVCKQLKSFEDTSIKDLHLSGNKCIAHIIIMKMSSLRYNDSKGLVHELKNFLIENFSKNPISRYRGNRINIIFHLAYIYYLNRNLFLLFLKAYRQNTKLCKDLELAFNNDIAFLQLKVLAIVGKIFSGPWMTKFYTSLKDQGEHTDVVLIVKELIVKIELLVEEPIKVLDCTCDLFGEVINYDEGMIRLMAPPPPKNYDLFVEMMKAVLMAINGTLQRQYKNSFDQIDILKQKALTSARMHTMEAESVLAEFTGIKDFTPVVDALTVSNIIKAKRNKVLDFLQNSDVEFCEKIIKIAISQTTSEQLKNTQNKMSVQATIKERICNKKKKLESKNKKKVEDELKRLEEEHPTLPEDEIIKLFPNHLELRNILVGDILGRNITHIYNVDGIDQEFKGTVINLENNLYSVLYFQENLEEEVSEISKYKIGSDYVFDDLCFV